MDEYYKKQYEKLTNDLYNLLKDNKSKYKQVHEILLYLIENKDNIYDFANHCLKESEVIK